MATPSVAFGKLALHSSSFSSQIPTRAHHLTLNAYANTQCIPHFFSTLIAGTSAGKRRSLYLQWGNGCHAFKTKNIWNSEIGLQYVQSLHQKELRDLRRWWKSSGLSELKFTRQRVTEIYFSPASFIVDPELATCRAVYTKMSIFTVTLDNLNLFSEGLKSALFTGEILTDALLSKIGRGSRFVQLMGFTGRLAERGQGEVASAVQCYMKDHPEEEALKHVYTVMENVLDELNREFVNNIDVPDSCRRLVFETARIMQLFYMKGDGLTLSHEMEIKEHVENYLFQPVA